MASKGLSMLELVVFLIGRHSMGMDHHLYQAFLRVHFAHGAAAAAAAVVAPKRLQKTRLTIIKIPNGKISMLPYSI